jgi:hypothetical protein
MVLKFFITLESAKIGSRWGHRGGVSGTSAASWEDVDCVLLELEADFPLLMDVDGDFGCCEDAGVGNIASMLSVGSYGLRGSKLRYQFRKLSFCVRTAMSQLDDDLYGGDSTRFRLLLL